MSHYEVLRAGNLITGFGKECGRCCYMTRLLRTGLSAGLVSLLRGVSVCRTLCSCWIQVWPRVAWSSEGRRGVRGLGAVTLEPG